MTDRHSKLARAIPMSRTSLMLLANVFLGYRIAPVGILAYLLTADGPQVVSKFFTLVCRHLGTKQLTTTACNSKRNRQTKRSNRTIFARLQHYIAEQQRDWHLYVHPYRTRITHQSIDRQTPHLEDLIKTSISRVFPSYTRPRPRHILWQYRICSRCAVKSKHAWQRFERKSTRTRREAKHTINSSTFVECPRHSHF